MADINAKTKLLCLLGNPVEHSLSPIIHENLSKIKKKNYAYMAFCIEKEALGDAVKGLTALGTMGANVTVPHKKVVMQYLKEIDEKAFLIGAVNTLVPVEDGFKGYNTDMPGLWRAMEFDGIAIQGQNAVVIGAGGASNAVVCMLLEAGAKNIMLLNRSKEKAVQLAEHFRNAYEKACITVAAYEENYLEMMERLAGDEKWLAIQATSVGMHPNVTDTAIETADFYDKIEIGYDLIFNPAKTRFMSLVEEHGGKAYNGLKMLLFQGVMAYELWTGEKITDEEAGETLRKLEEASASRL